jgi:hypothetical protein
MANSAVSLTSLDFDTLKSNFVKYLTSQSVLKDYDYTGSNINVLLDLLSYNTYLNSFYLNMVASEMFLDSAQKLDSVVSHAKELNYTPKSAKSAAANISFTVTTTGINSPLSIPKGTIFSGQNSNGQFQFVTALNQNFTSSNNVFAINNLQIYEGSYLTDVFTVDYTQSNQRFILSNPGIDTDSLIITAIENNVNTFFTPVTTLFNLNPESNVYFLQAAQNNQYEIVFGDGNLGRIPNNLATIVATYRVTTGAAGQGVSSFLITQDLGVINGGIATLSTITTIANSSGGSAAESIDVIRKNAPRYFATQQRAVASDDYSSLVLSQFGGQIADASVFGGELLNPKQYGKVAVCLKPQGATVAPNYLKNQILNYLTPYVSLPTTVLITDPDYTYIGVNSTVQYNVTGTTEVSSQIQAVITSAINQFSKNNLELFNADFRYSKFAASIDASDPSITSNDTQIKIIKRISPLLNYPTSYVLDYNNPTEVESRISAEGYVAGLPFYDEPMITSSSFTYVDSTGTQWPLSYIRDDNFGTLVVYTTINNVFTVINPNLGTVNYITGELIINALETSFYNQYISIYMEPATKDILVNRDKILKIDLADVTVNVIPTQK